MAIRLDIRVQGQSLDLPPDSNNLFYITKQINDILAGLETREGDFSRSLTIPNTPKNRALTDARLPFNFEVQAQSFILCEVLMDGVSVMPDGRLLASSTTLHSITITMFGGNTSFIRQLSDRSLKALNLNAYNFTLTQDGSAGQKNNTTGVVMPWNLFTDNLSYRKFAEGGGVANDFALQYTNLQWGGFWFYIDTMLEEIFKDFEGLTVDRSGLSDQFRKLAFQNPVRRFVDGWEVPDGFKSSGFRDTDQNINDATTVILIPTTFDDPGGLWNGTGWTMDKNALIQISIQLYVHNPDQFLISSAEMVILKNGVEVDTYQYSVFIGSYETHEYSTSVNAETGDIIQIGVRLYGQFLNPQIIKESTQTIEQLGANPDKDLIIANEMPDISQKDFVLNAFKWFNIIATESAGVVTLSYWDQIADRPAALTKSIGNLELEGTKILANYASNNYLKYADNDLIERADTTGNFIINSEVIAADNIAIELIFSASDLSETPGGAVGMVANPLFQYEFRNIDNNKMKTSGTSYSTADANGLKNGDLVLVGGNFVQVQSVTDSKSGIFTTSAGTGNDQDWQTIHVTNHGDGLHVAQMEPVDTPSINYYDGNQPGAGYGSAMVATFPEDLLFSRIINNYFDNLTRTLQNPAIIQVWLNFSILEYLTLDQTRPIYIESFAQNFYINKIEQYKLEGLTRVELIRL